MPKEHLAHELQRLLPGRQILTRPAELLVYEADAGLDVGRPDAVVLVRSAEDVATLVKWAASHGVPVVARGAGTGVSGGAIAERGGLMLAFNRMNRVLSIDEDARLAVVEPGVINTDLDALARGRGLYYPPDPASGRSATLGGNIAENAGGPHCFKYGVTTNYVAGLDVVLADGRQIALGGPSADYPEYDFVGLLTGSEGTLGIITSAIVRLIPAPPAVQTMLAAFDSVEEAGQAVSAIIAAGLTPSTLEMMDRKMARIVEEFAGAGLPADAAAVLIIEVDGHEAGLTGQMDEIAAELRSRGVTRIRMAADGVERENLWYGRKSVAGAVARLAPAYFSVDITVPRSTLAVMLSRVDAICAEAGLPVGHVLHAGDGNLHPDILVSDPQDRALMAKVHTAVRKFVEVALQLDGSITGEHGVGTEKRDLMPLMFSPAELSAMADVKAVFDPLNVLNPGKILPPQAAPPGPAITQAGEPGRSGNQRRAATRTARPRADSTTWTPASAAEAAEMMAACCAPDTPEPRPLRIAGSGTKTLTPSAWAPDHRTPGLGRVDPAAGASAAAPGPLATLDTRGMAGITVCAPDDLYVTVAAGSRLADLQDELASRKLWAPLASPWPTATIGGIVASACNAPLRMRYGSIRDQVLSATVVLPDGRILRTGRPLVKNVAGYDLTKLFVGSYGTLGLLADVTLKLVALPRCRVTLAWPVADYGRGLLWGRSLLRRGIVGSAALLCSGAHVPGCDAPYALLYTAEGVEGDVRGDIAAAVAALEAGGAAEPSDLGPLSGTDVWAAWMAAASAAPSVTLLRLGMVRASAADGPPPAPFCLDLSCGVAHVAATPDRDPAQALERYLSALGTAGGYAVPLRGRAPLAAPQEAGPQCTAIWPERDRPAVLDLMRRLKARWDPHACCNPGAHPLDGLL